MQLYIFFDFLKFNLYCMFAHTFVEIFNYTVHLHIWIYNIHIYQKWKYCISGHWNVFSTCCCKSTKNNITDLNNCTNNTVFWYLFQICISKDYNIIKNHKGASELTERIRPVPVQLAKTIFSKNKLSTIVLIKIIFKF